VEKLWNLYCLPNICRVVSSWVKWELLLSPLYLDYIGLWNSVQVTEHRKPTICLALTPLFHFLFRLTSDEVRTLIFDVFTAYVCSVCVSAYTAHKNWQFLPQNLISSQRWKKFLTILPLLWSGPTIKVIYVRIIWVVKAIDSGGFESQPLYSTSQIQHLCVCKLFFLFHYH
jgi:hypothetical protein